jgi:hypothetical protein
MTVLIELIFCYTVSVIRMNTLSDNNETFLALIQPIGHTQKAHDNDRCTSLHPSYRY